MEDILQPSWGLSPRPSWIPYSNFLWRLLCLSDVDDPRINQSLQ